MPGHDSFPGLQAHRRSAAAELVVRRRHPVDRLGLLIGWVAERFPALGLSNVAESAFPQTQARVNPLSDLPANVDTSESAVPARPYSFIDDIRRILRVPPPSTLVLFLITVVAFIGQLLGGSSDWQWAVGIVPVNVTDVSSIMLIGERQLVPAWLTLFSYMFLHSGFFHLLANMAGLWMFGMLAEPVVGTTRFALTYLVFGVIAGMAIVAIVPHWTSPMVGASGSISGILGAFLAQHFSKWISQGRRNLAVLLLEALSLLAVVTWFLIRPIPSEPDRPSSVAWHLVPFLFAWYSVRTWKGLGDIRRTSHCI
jgi:membrane associated rhomboid family serine protease